ncbi:putative pectate lyase C [Sulfidibacter corallicola]|uniref:Probable pectate lyase C n=1 Tax=Sulfidibacter corallicola TaxID=2818388 RepID=A0A8A4TYP8_SULCO|nr:hypothetical protein [Sulfidibacter corallicola]QTD54072.1 hypothetical protein J3U87_16625 [Sulfidibacter corallicola]
MGSRPIMSFPLMLTLSFAFVFGASPGTSSLPEMDPPLPIEGRSDVGLHPHGQRRFLPAARGTPSPVYTPPIGIPDPDWGAFHPITVDTPSLPSDWSQAVDGYFYIQPSHPGSTDTDNPFGTPTRPRSTIPRNIPAGGVVVLSGSFDDNVSRTITAQGTADNPCWITGLNEAEAPTVIGSLVLLDTTYTVVEHLDFNGGDGNCITIRGMNSHHVAVRHNRFRNRVRISTTAALASVPDLGGALHDIVIYDNEFRELGDVDTVEDLDFHAYAPTLWGRDATTTQHHLWFLSNTCHRVSGDCMQVNAGNWTDSYRYLHHIYAGRNTASENRQSAIWVKQASDVIVSQNHAYDMHGGGGGNAGSGFGGQYEKDNVWFLFNSVHDSVYGFRQSDTGTGALDGQIYYIGNLIFDIRPNPDQMDDYDDANSWSQGTGIALWHGNSDRYVVDNTLYNVFDGINAIFDGGLEISGNIISMIDDRPRSVMLSLEHPLRNGHATFDRNLFFDDMGLRFWLWPEGGGSAAPTDVPGVIAATGQCQDCIEGDPRFTGVERGDYSLRADSPAIGENVKHPAYDLFQARYGIDIFVDYLGRPRDPESHALGAFEFLPSCQGQWQFWKSQGEVPASLDLDANGVVDIRDFLMQIGSCTATR